MDWNSFFATLRRGHAANAPRQEPAAEGRGRMRARARAPSARRGSAGRQALAGAGGVLLALCIGAGMVMLQASAGDGFLIVGLAGLCGLVICDVIDRRGWEKIITGQLQDTMAGQTRLAREVARNRDDIAVLKDGLAETASAINSQAKRLPAAAAGIESRILNTVAARFGALGRKPAPKARPESANVAELDLPPPPRRAPQESRAERTANGQYTDQALGQMVRDAVQRDRIGLFVQPVVALPQRKVRMLEALARVPAKAGAFVPAERYMRAAANDSMVPVIDDLVLLQCLNALAASLPGLPGDVPFVINLDVATLKDKGFMNTLVTFIGRHREAASRLVFELPQAAFDGLGAPLVPLLEALSKLGCRFSMDGVRKRRFDIDRLKALQVRFVKLDAAWLMQEAAAPGGAARINRLKKQFDAAGIDLIVERIETENDLRELLDFNIDLGQGYLFGKPELFEAWRDRQNRGRKTGKAA